MRDAIRAQAEWKRKHKAERAAAVRVEEAYAAAAQPAPSIAPAQMPPPAVTRLFAPKSKPNVQPHGDGGFKPAPITHLFGKGAKSWARQPIEANTPEDATAFADAWGVTSAAGRKLLAEICMTEGGIRRATMAMRVAAMQAKAADRNRTDADLREAWMMVRGAA